MSFSVKEEWKGAQSRGWCYPQKCIKQNQGRTMTPFRGFVNTAKHKCSHEAIQFSLSLHHLRFASVPHHPDGMKPFTFWFATPEKKHWQSRSLTPFVFLHSAHLAVKQIVSLNLWRFYIGRIKAVWKMCVHVCSSPTAGARPLAPWHFPLEKCWPSPAWCWTAGSIWMERCQKARYY